MAPRLILVLALLLSPLCRAAVSLTTIDLIEVSTSSPALPHTYNPGGSFLLLVEEKASVHLSTGEVGSFGAGGSGGSSTTYVSTLESGGQLRFNLNPITGGRFYERASFSTPLPFVRTGFRLDLLGPLALVATSGSFDAVLSGTLLVSRNGLAPPFEGTDAALLGAGEGEFIPFSVTYTRQGTPWTAAAFDAPFSYTFNARLDTAAIPEPAVPTALAVALGLLGVRRRRSA